MSDQLLDYEEDDRYDRGSSEESDDSVQEDGEVSSSDGGGNVPADDSSAAKSNKLPGLQFCPRHKPGMMVEVCTTCRAALAIVRPEMVKQLFMSCPHLPMLLPDMQAGLMSIRVRQSHQPGHGSSV